MFRSAEIAESIGESDADFIKLPNEEKARRLCETLQRLNPEIRVTEEYQVE